MPSQCSEQGEMVPCMTSKQIDRLLLPSIAHAIFEDNTVLEEIKTKLVFYKKKQTIKDIFEEIESYIIKEVINYILHYTGNQLQDDVVNCCMIDLSIAATDQGRCHTTARDTHVRPAPRQVKLQLHTNN